MTSRSRVKIQVVEKSNSEDDPSINDRFHRFNILLGRGAYKEVYKAFDTVTQLDVAWNSINLSSVREIDKAKIYKETMLLARLNHPNILKMRAKWTNPSEDTLIFITDLVQDGSLSKHFRERAINLSRVKHIAKQILSALEYLHSEELIHRDLKCDNIFIDGVTGRVVIGDLGLSCGVESAASIVGTPHWMAPELYKEDYNELVDIWSFGMCILELVCNEIPYSDILGPFNVYKAILDHKLPEVISRINDLYVKSFIKTCLQFDPKKRPSATELLQHPFLWMKIGDYRSCESIMKPSKKQSPPPEEDDEEEKVKQNVHPPATIGVQKSVKKSVVMPMTSPAGNNFNIHSHTKDNTKPKNVKKRKSTFSCTGGMLDIPRATVVSSRRSKEGVKIKFSERENGSKTLKIKMQIVCYQMSNHKMNVEFVFKEDDNAKDVADEMIHELSLPSNFTIHVLNAIEYAIKEQNIKQVDSNMDITPIIHDIAQQKQLTMIDDTTVVEETIETTEVMNANIDSPKDITDKDISNASVGSNGSSIDESDPYPMIVYAAVKSLTPNIQPQQISVNTSARTINNNDDENSPSLVYAVPQTKTPEVFELVKTAIETYNFKPPIPPTLPQIEKRNETSVNGSYQPVLAMSEIADEHTIDSDRELEYKTEIVLAIKTVAVPVLGQSVTSPTASLRIDASSEKSAYLPCFKSEPNLTTNIKDVEFKENIFEQVRAQSEQPLKMMRPLTKTYTDSVIQSSNASKLQSNSLIDKTCVTFSDNIGGRSQSIPQTPNTQTIPLKTINVPSKIVTMINKQLIEKGHSSVGDISDQTTIIDNQPCFTKKMSKSLPSPMEEKMPATFISPVISEVMEKFHNLDTNASELNIYSVTIKMSADELSDQFERRRKKYNLKEEGVGGLARRLATIVKQEMAEKKQNVDNNGKKSGSNSSKNSSPHKTNSTGSLSPPPTVLTDDMIQSLPLNTITNNKRRESYDESAMVASDSPCVMDDSSSSTDKIAANNALLNAISPKTPNCFLSPNHNMSNESFDNLNNGSSGEPGATIGETYDTSMKYELNLAPINHTIEFTAEQILEIEERHQQIVNEFYDFVQTKDSLLALKIESMTQNISTLDGSEIINDNSNCTSMIEEAREEMANQIMIKIEKLRNAFSEFMVDRESVAVLQQTIENKKRSVNNNGNNTKINENVIDFLDNVLMFENDERFLKLHKKLGKMDQILFLNMIKDRRNVMVANYLNFFNQTMDDYQSYITAHSRPKHRRNISNSSTKSAMSNISNVSFQQKFASPPPSIIDH